MSELLIREASIAILSTGGAFGVSLKDAKAKDPKKDYWNEVTASDRYGDGAMRLGVWYGTRGYRLTTRAVGPTEMSAYQMREKARAALEYALLDIGGVVTTPVMFETAEEIGEDNGAWSGLTTWTCTL